MQERAPRESMRGDSRWDSVSKEQGILRYSEGDGEGVAREVGRDPRGCHCRTRGTMGVIRC